MQFDSTVTAQQPGEEMKDLTKRRIFRGILTLCLLQVSFFFFIEFTFVFSKYFLRVVLFKSENLNCYLIILSPLELLFCLGKSSCVFV